MSESMEVQKRLKSLLEYVHHLGEMNQKPVFKIDEYKNLKFAEHELVGRIGIQHDLLDQEGGSIWLTIERLKRMPPPPIPEDIKEWISVSNDPKIPLNIKEKIIKTLPEKEFMRLIADGVVKESDIQDPIHPDQSEVPKKDVILRLENDPGTKAKIDLYQKTSWYPWAEKEKPRRTTIRIYDALFNLQQTMEVQSEEQPLELVWGIGVTRWNCEGHIIDHPLVEKFIEIEIDEVDGSIKIRPRNIEPTLAISPYFALQNTGVDALIRFTKKHLTELSDDVEFSPFVKESYEAILRQAATQLSHSGSYWPDVTKENEDRQPPSVAVELRVSDCWILFARPRSRTTFIQDIERFQKQLSAGDDLEIFPPAKRLVSELSDKKPLFGLGGPSTTEPSYSASPVSKKSELYFPKPFNEAQVAIIDQLEQSDGVVVQGPPGTGKTHTIANIICHYLATGRTVLVTSKGEPALDVLREQIPEELRNLTISLLTNERLGLKQLEGAVKSLAGLVSQTNLRDLQEEAAIAERRANDLQKSINQIDVQIKEWGEKQLQPINRLLTDANLQMTAMDLAKEVVKSHSEHQWLPDSLGIGPEFTPQFSDEDIAEVRNARRTLGKDITYVNKQIPAINDLYEGMQLAAIHQDLLQAADITNQIESGSLPHLSLTGNDAVSRSNNLLPKLQDLASTVGNLNKSPWLREIFDNWMARGLGTSKLQLFEGLMPTMKEMTDRRKELIKNPVVMPELGNHREAFERALSKLCEGRKPFGIFSFGNTEVTALLNQVEIQGEKPNRRDHWQQVKRYLGWQDDMRRLISKWNSMSQEYNLPAFTYHFGDTFKILQEHVEQIYHAATIATKVWPAFVLELRQLFPHGLEIDRMLHDQQEVERAIKAINLQTSQINLMGQRQRLEALKKKLTSCNGPIVEQFLSLITNEIGNKSYSAEQVSQKWNVLVQELIRLHEYRPQLQTVSRISEKFYLSGAPLWSEKVLSDPLINGDDVWTPTNWFETWKWKRQAAYLKEIDSRGKIKEVVAKRTRLDNEIKRTFTELVRLKTHIGLRESMTERVQGALIRFAGALARLGRGTGKIRSPRYKREASRAMQDCYAGVPCWIMPTWRVSENLPSELGSFNLVIIDEASQSDITALPAILRAKKLLIVGDDKQVSPTGTFIAEEKILQLKHNFLRGQPFADLVLPGVSIYDLASVTFPGQRIMLTEHFRCVEPIIRFSMQFYTEPLVPLRLPKKSERLDPPLVDVYVAEGRRDERREINSLEAEAIVDEIKAISKDPKFKGRSIGVISLIGSKQAQEIQSLLLRELGEDIYQEFKIQCGDSANFQGKEKDIVFLSMVVGPNQGAALNKREYAQRFNVALSRARDRMYLFRSVREADLRNETDYRLKVLRHFACPLPQQDQVNNPLDLCDSDFERDVYKKLTALGYWVTPQVKVGPYRLDLVVEGEQDRRIAIELDGDKYHPPEKWADDFSRQRTMERMGWTFWRCWGSSYTMNPENCIEDLVESMNSLGIHPIGQHARSNIYTEKREYRPTQSEEFIDKVESSPEISTDSPAVVGGMENSAMINEIIQKLTEPLEPGQRGTEWPWPLSEKVAHEVVKGLQERGLEPKMRKTRSSEIIVRVEPP